MFSPPNFLQSMNILHVISQHPESTGSGIYLQNLLRQAAAAGHRNFLVAGVTGDCLPRLAGIVEESCRFVRFAGLDLDFAIPGMSDVMPYPSSRFSELSPESLLRYEQAFAAKISQVAGEFSIDLVHSHHLWLASAVTRRTLPRIPMVTSCHSTDLRQFVQCPHLQGRVVGDCRKIDRIVALSSSQAERIVSLYAIAPDKIGVAGIGFDEEIFTGKDRREAGPVHLLYAGKLSYAKGVDWLLRVFGNFAGQEAHLPVHLHLAGSGSGSGEEARECLEMAARMGQRVTVHGPLSQQELARLMRRCHIFVLPSFYEGLPMVLLEALASGCRLVATDLSGCLELLGNAAPELVEFVALPPLCAIDRPDARDWGLLDSKLQAALSVMTRRVISAPSPPYEEIPKITGRSSWKTVFGKIAEAYDRARRCHGLW